MKVEEILALDRIRCGHLATSKKKVLECTAELLSSADASVPAHAISEGLFARERLGSTGLGGGVAIPHTRRENVERATGAFLKLREPVEFDAPDGAPVDLVFGLMVPDQSTGEHLQILAELAELFSDLDLRARLRGSRTPREVLDVLTRR